MKKNVLILIFSLCAISFTCAFAQNASKDYKTHIVKWYEDINSISKLYSIPVDVIVEVNCLTSKTLKARQVLLIPENYVAPVVNDTFPSQVVPLVPVIKADTVVTLIPEDPNKFSIGLVLPFHDRKESVNNNSSDFYCGTLMALKQVKDEGLDIHLIVNDFSDNVDSAQLAGCKFIIGPIRSGDVSATIKTVGTDKLVVSPLDTRVDSLLSQYPNIIQAAVSSEKQWNSVIEWKGSSNLPVRWVIVTSEHDQSTDNDFFSLAKNLGTNTSLVKCGVTGNILGWDTIFNEFYHFNVVLAISNEAILNNAVRNMSIFVPKGNVTVFCNSRIRSYDSIPVENIHKANVYSFCSYFVDYSDPKTLDFIHKYRALYSSEPSQFAFQGYDLTYFMLKTYSKYGSEWKTKICFEDKWQMIQTCFKFVQQSGGSLANEGIRIVEYGKDWTLKSVD